MKHFHYFKSLIVVLFLLTTSGILSAQEFTVKIPSTDDYGHLFKPIKADSSFQFKISVTNNRTDVCTVSIIKDDMGYVEPWVTIKNNKQTIDPHKTVNFSLTIHVPSGACDCDYHLPLRFHVYVSQNVDFDYESQTIIVDNSAPDTPTFSMEHPTSTTVTVADWASSDKRSIEYTRWNNASGVKGIKNYTIILRNPVNNAIIKSKTIDATGVNYCTFPGLVPNTNYKVSVIAKDLAGNNSNTKSTIATTAPAKPSNLSFSNTTYISTTLTWTPSPGATGYSVYLFNGNNYVKLNSAPITANSYTIDSLKPDTTYSCYARALSNVGTSDWSDKASVKTLALPYITGPSLVCTGNYTFTLSSLVSGYSVSWSSSANLHLSSTSGISAIFSVVSTGQGQINASITAPSGKVLNLTNKAVWVGVPSFYIYGDNDLMPNQPGMAVIYQNGTSVGTIESWSYYGPLRYFKGDISKARYRAGTQSGNGFIYATVRMPVVQLKTECITWLKVFTMYIQILLTMFFQ